MDRARKGKGPSIIEAKFLRLLGHFVADDQWYRDLEAVKPYWELDPIVRMRGFLVDSGAATADEVAAIEKNVEDEIAEAIRYASEDCTEPSLDVLYDNIYADGEIIK